MKVITTCTSTSLHNFYMIITYCSSTPTSPYCGKAKVQDRKVKEGGAHPLSMITRNSSVFPFQAAQ